MAKAETKAEGKAARKKTEVVVTVSTGIRPVAAAIKLLQATGSGEGTVAYLLYGIPDTDSWALLNLNDLPDDMTAIVQFQRDGQARAVSQFRGKLGNTVVSTGVSSPEPGEARALVIPGNVLSEETVLAIIDAMSGPIRQTVQNVIEVEALPLAVAARLDEAVADKYLGGVEVGGIPSARS